jgi:DNA polymerase-1
LVEDILKAFNIPILKVEGFEADDILGTISEYVSNGKWRDYNLDMYILSGDRDLLQLVDENVRVCLPEGNFKNIRVYDRIETFKKYGYYPEQVIDYKAVVGDASDNIPGVKGVGKKQS